jgi:hypothetical protein
VAVDEDMVGGGGWWWVVVLAVLVGSVDGLGGLMRCSRGDVGTVSGLIPSGSWEDGCGSMRDDSTVDLDGGGERESGMVSTLLLL